MEARFLPVREGNYKCGKEKTRMNFIMLGLESVELVVFNIDMTMNGNMCIHECVCACVYS